jgi:hypothetical protein
MKRIPLHSAASLLLLMPCAGTALAQSAQSAQQSTQCSQSESQSAKPRRKSWCIEWWKKKKFASYIFQTKCVALEEMFRYIFFPKLKYIFNKK